MKNGLSKKALLALTFAVVSVASMSASAEMVHANWLSSGDNLVTKDTTSGLEFLKLTETAGMSFNEVAGLLDSTFSGWRFSTIAESAYIVEQVFYNSDFSVGVYSPLIKDSESLSQMDMFGVVQQNQSFYSYGMVMSEDGDFFRYGSGYGGGGVVYASYGQPLVNFTADLAASPYAPLLVRNTIDASAPLALSGLALLGFGLVRRRKEII